MNPFSLEEKRILITGASSGIGAATARACAQMGASLVLTARNEQRLKDLAEELQGNCLQYIVADLTQSFDEVLIEGSDMSFDGVICNAGKLGFASSRFLSKERLEDVFSLNLYSNVALIRALLKRGKISKPASIVFTSSIAGVYHAHPASPAYDMSKAALDAYMRALALELGPKGIRVNSVNPGHIDTPLTARLPLTDEQFEADLAKYPLGRYGTPMDVAWGIVYLLSEASSWVTGSRLKIDGGRTLF